MGEKSDEFPVLVFADGACSGNPGPGGWAAVVCLRRESLKDAEVVELAGFKDDTTNNRMELTAVGKALRHLERVPGAIAIFTDSSYVINGLTKWIHGWKKGGWKKSDGEVVANARFWKRLLELIEARVAAGLGGVEFHYVPGHSGVPGNERCDALAVECSKGGRPALFTGRYGDYLRRFGVDLFEGIDAAAASGANGGSSPPPARGKKGPPVYLSLVDGKVERHATWSECEARVKGRAGAKFKKCRDDAEAARVMREWE
ncbi:MAG: viroplasmin family protein [Deltaproteobacteria bacterium]|nr:viroplasmin family protein [Deltaproteobacteria bacterium]